MIKKIYLDMDGVLSDFDGMLKLIRGPDHRVMLPDDEFWAMIMSIPNFWTEMPLMKDATELVEYCKTLKVPIEILTAPSRSDYVRCYSGKIQWTEKYNFTFPINFARARYKRFYAKPGHLLIDDNKQNIEGFLEDGGLAIWHRDLETTIKQIKEFMNEPVSNASL